MLVGGSRPSSYVAPRVAFEAWAARGEWVLGTANVGPTFTRFAPRAPNVGPTLTCFAPREANVGPTFTCFAPRAPNVGPTLTCFAPREANVGPTLTCFAPREANVALYWPVLSFARPIQGLWRPI